jgi:hypothetical protein
VSRGRFTQILRDLRPDPYSLWMFSLGDLAAGSEECLGRG